MTNATIKDTAEEYAKKVRDYRIKTGEDDQSTAMLLVMKDQWPGEEPRVINAALVFNSVEIEWEKTRQTVKKNHYVSTGQFDLFGYPPFMIPEECEGTFWMKTPITNTGRVYQADKATADLNAEEHRKLWDKYAEKSKFIAKQYEAWLGFVKVVEAKGYDPEVMTYEEAKKKGITLHASAADDVGKKTEL